MVNEALDQAAKNLEAGNFKQALKEYQAMVTIDPQNALAYQRLGYIYCHLGRYDEATAACRKALELDSTLARPHTSLGAIYFTRRQFVDSEKESLEAAGIVMAYPKQTGYVFSLSLVLILLYIQPAIGLLGGLGLGARGVWESIISFRSGARKQAILSAGFAFLLLGLSVYVSIASGIWCTTESFKDVIPIFRQYFSVCGS